MIMVNVNIVNAALWRVQFAKAEQSAYNRKHGLEGSWAATQHMAGLLAQESALVNIVNLLKAGKNVDADCVSFIVDRVVATLPAVN